MESSYQIYKPYIIIYETIYAIPYMILFSLVNLQKIKKKPDAMFQIKL